MVRNKMEVGLDRVYGLDRYIHIILYRKLISNSCIACIACRVFNVKSSFNLNFGCFHRKCTPHTLVFSGTCRVITFPKVRLINKREVKI